MDDDLPIRKENCFVHGEYCSPTPNACSVTPYPLFFQHRVEFPRLLRVFPHSVVLLPFQHRKASHPVDIRNSSHVRCSS